MEIGAGEEISDLTASRDLKAMVDAQLLQAVGERRARYYIAAQPLLDARAAVRAGRPPKALEDPFVLVREGRRLSLPTG